MESIVYLDTHVVAWLYTGELQIFSKASRKLLDTAATLRISPIVVLELEYLHEVGRLAVPSAVVVASVSEHLGLHLCTGDFALIVERAKEEKWTRDPFDRIIVAQAALAGAPLLTKDRTIRRHYPLAQW